MTNSGKRRDPITNSEANAMRDYAYTIAGDRYETKGAFYKLIAKKFGVCESTAYGACKGVHFFFCPPQLPPLSKRTSARSTPLGNAKIKAMKDFAYSIAHKKVYKDKTEFCTIVAKELDTSITSVAKYCKGAIQKVSFGRSGNITASIHGSRYKYPQLAKDRTLELVKLGYSFSRIRNTLRDEYYDDFKGKPNAPSDLWIQDCIKKGFSNESTHKQNEDVYMLKKLSKKQYLEILALKPVDFDIVKRSKGKSAYKVAEQYDISHQTIYNIWNGKYKFPPNHSTIDTDILKKIIPIFAETDVEIDFSPKEIVRIEQLYKEL